VITIAGYDFGDTRPRAASPFGADADWAKAVPVGHTATETPLCRLAPEPLSARLDQARSRKRPRSFVIDFSSKPHQPGESSTMSKTTFTAILEREGDVYVALCPELDIASQGGTIEEATANLRDAVALFLETADSREITQRLRSGVFVTTFDVVDG
jgi:predicted RNase H-like HicB family nuclease